MQGGLGNQLFCLAFARTLHLLTGDLIGIDLTSYSGYRFGHRYALWDLAERIDGVIHRDAPMIGHRVISGGLRSLRWSLPGYVSEPRGPVDGAVAMGLSRRRGYFDGYWQDEAYVLDPAPFVAVVRDFIADRSSPSEPVEVALHFRTYAEENHPVFSRTPGREYFIRAVARIEADLGPVSRILLLSDNPDVAMRRIGDIGRRIDPTVGAGAFDDLRRLMEARALILTNSSFSWWGAYCGRAEVVTYPPRDGLFHYPIPAPRFVCF